MKKIDPFLAVAIFGSTQFDQPEVLDDVGGEEVDDDLQQPFDLFFDRTALERLNLTKSDSPARIRTQLTKAATTYRGSIARTEERLIDNIRWVCAFDCDGNLIDAQQVSGDLGKRGSDLSWDDEVTLDGISEGFQKRTNARIATFHAVVDKIFAGWPEEAAEVKAVFKEALNVERAQVLGG
jgi:hypothetical protein